MSRMARLAAGEELWSNPLCVSLQGPSITHHLMNLCETVNSLRCRQAGGTRPQDGLRSGPRVGRHMTVVVRRDPATGDTPPFSSGSGLPAVLREAVTPRW